MSVGKIINNDIKKAVYLFFPKVFTERKQANRETVVGNKSGTTISDQTA